MFTGIIECVGIVKSVLSNGSNKSFWIESSISDQLKPDQSVSHNGVCLTVEELNANSHRVTAIEETLKKTNLDHWSQGSLVNIERCLLLNDRLDGHIVQGHIDTTGICTNKKQMNGSWELEIEFPKKLAPLIVEKGSICVDGISLTAFNVKKKHFSVAIIPYTWDNTNLKDIKEGDQVNLEFDIIGKYLLRSISLSKGL